MIDSITEIFVQVAFLRTRSWFKLDPHPPQKPLKMCHLAPGRDSSEDSVRKTTGDHLLLTYLGWCRIFDKWRWPQKRSAKFPSENSGCLLGKSMISWLLGRERSLILRQIRIDRWVWCNLSAIPKSKMSGNVLSQLPNHEKCYPQHFLRFCPGEPLALEEQRRKMGKLGKPQQVGIMSVDSLFRFSTSKSVEFAFFLIRKHHELKKHTNNQFYDNPWKFNNITPKNKAIPKKEGLRIVFPIPKLPPFFRRPWIDFLQDCEMLGRPFSPVISLSISIGEVLDHKTTKHNVLLIFGHLPFFRW